MYVGFYSSASWIKAVSVGLWQCIWDYGSECGRLGEHVG